MPDLIDLSYVINEDIPVYPGTPLPNIEKLSDIRTDGYLESNFTLSTHTGTHIDVEKHISDQGKTISQYEIEQFFGTAQTIDCSACRKVQTDHITDAIDLTDLPDFILFITKWDRYWGSEEYFTGYPVLTDAAARYLSKMPLKGIGIDACSFDIPDTCQLTNHKVLLENGLILIENLKGLSKLVNKKFTFTCFPLKIEKGDGSPVRACAIVND